MVSFIHIADKNDEQAILRNGIRSIPDEHLVLVGAYNGEKLEMTAAVALDAVLKHTDPMGLEVVIPRKITAREIARTYLAPQTTGWRYYPTAKRKPPFCRCKWCNRGEIRAKRIIREDA